MTAPSGKPTINSLEYAYANTLPGTVAVGSRAIDSATESTVQLGNPAHTGTTDQAQGYQQGLASVNEPYGAVDPTGDNPADQHLTDIEGAPMGDHSAQLPNAPTGITAVAGSAGHATVGWTAPVDADGYGITGYEITASSVSSGATTPVVKTVGAVLTADVSGLTTAKVYTFVVKAINVAGKGAASAASGNVTIA